MYFIVNCFFLISVSLCAETKDRIDLSKQEGNFEGDIVIGTKDRNAIFATQKWTNNIIPYEYDSRTGWTQDYKDMINNAINEIQGQTCIRFKPRTNEQNYLIIYKGSGCSSHVGMYGGSQYVSLAEVGCWYHGTIVHEFLHAVGLWHEQSRYDRDDFISVRLENVVNNMGFNFDLKTPNETSTYGVPYNYDSVMHYGKDAFSKNGEITLETLDPDMQDRIGNRDHGVDTDYEKVRRIYQCKGSYPSMPKPYVPPPAPCEDKITYCHEQKTSCTSQSWMNTYCRKTCGFCDPGCKDDVTYCKDYKKQKQCNVQAWLKTSCRKTCRFCSVN